MIGNRGRRRTVDLVLIMLSGGLLAAGGIGIGSAHRVANEPFSWAPTTVGAGRAAGPSTASGQRPVPAESTPIASPRPAPTASVHHRSSSPPSPGPGRPVRLTIQRLEITMPVRPVGILPDGQMQLPDRPATLGWYRYGPRPGAVGSAVLAGHVDSIRYGVGPLARLRSIRSGDRLTVVTSAGRAGFRVVRAGLIAKRDFPARRLFDRTGSPRLWLLTCGGPYDPHHGGYQDNLVVEAVPE